MRLVKNWVLRGLLWGFFMFLALSLIFPLYEGEKISVLRIAWSLVFWLLIGLVYGYGTQQIDRRKE